MKSREERKRRISCACCGKSGFHVTRGYRTECWERWVAAGKPDTGPPPPMSRSEAGARGGRRPDVKAARLEDYRILRYCRDWTRSEAAAAVGVSMRTTVRYDKALREQGVCT